MTGKRKKTQKKTIVIQCIDCALVIGTEKGQGQQVENSWGLCGRCVAKRNGFIGARSSEELGIY